MPYGWLSTPEPAFFLHGVALVVEVVLGDRERLHAIGFEEDAEVELVGRQRLVIQRAILVGRAVHRAAVDEHLHEVLAGADVLGSLEHHVLEEMREPGAALALVLRADEVVHDDRIDRRVVILGDDHAQAVGQLGFGELDRRRGLRVRASGHTHGQREHRRYEQRVRISNPLQYNGGTMRGARLPQEKLYNKTTRFTARRLRPR